MVRILEMPKPDLPCKAVHPYLSMGAAVSLDVIKVSQNHHKGGVARVCKL